MKRFIDDFIKGSTPLVYHIMMAGFSAALALALPMAVRFIARQFLLFWSRMGEATEEKIDGAKMGDAMNPNSTNHGTLQSACRREKKRAFSSVWTHGNRVLPGDLPLAGRQNLQSGLHPGGKEFSLLRSKNPICETAGWIAIL